jgi:chromosome segregation ATPase
MSVKDAETSIRESFARRMASVVRRLDHLQEDDEIKSSLDALSEDLDKVEAELNALSVADDELKPGFRERLEARREHLMAKRERLELRAELRLERRERLEESLVEMQTELAESLNQVRLRTPSIPQVKVRAGRRSPPAGPRQLQEERRKILEMVQGGTVGAEDAAQLLDALRDQEESDRRHRRKPRWVRIRVTDLNGTARVNLTLPVGLVRAGLRAGGSIAGVEGLDTTELVEMLDRGEMGHLLDVRDADDGERIEIFVE